MPIDFFRAHFPGLYYSAITVSHTRDYAVLCVHRTTVTQLKCPKKHLKLIGGILKFRKIIIPQDYR